MAYDPNESTAAAINRQDREMRERELINELRWGREKENGRRIVQVVAWNRGGGWGADDVLCIVLDNGGLLWRLRRMVGPHAVWERVWIPPLPTDEELPAEQRP
jgi:hypothetical protein